MIHPPRYAAQCHGCHNLYVQQFISLTMLSHHVGSRTLVHTVLTVISDDSSQCSYRHPRAPSSSLITVITACLPLLRPRINTAHHCRTFLHHTPSPSKRQHTTLTVITSLSHPIHVILPKRCRANRTVIVPKRPDASSPSSHPSTRHHTFLSMITEHHCHHAPINIITAHHHPQVRAS